MKMKRLGLILALATAQMAGAQVTDPMVTNWWFNTTNHMYNGILTDVEAVYYTTTNVYVQTSGVPNYYKDGVTHNNAKDLNAVWVVPRVPVPATTHQGVMGGQIGLLADGSVAFHPGDAQSYNNAGVWNRLAYYFEGMDMDSSNGHSTPTNMYHHHFDDLKVHDWDSTKHSPIVGFAWDGYPIYGPYGYANADGTGGIIRNRSSYTLKNMSSRTNGPAIGGQYILGCFIEDWEYTANAGTLDQYNGRTVVTPEYPAGTYAYFTTVDASLKPVYPYFIGPTFYGTFSNANVGPSGGTTSIPGTATKYVLPSGISDLDKLNNAVQVYPIPVENWMNVKFAEKGNYTLVIYDVTGALLLKEKLTGSDRIDLRNYTHGAYLVEVTNDATGEGFIKRVVKK